MSKQPFPNPFIIGITGYKQSGKDTVAGLLHSQISRHDFDFVLKQGFADALKDEVAEILGVPRAELDKKKKHPLVRHIFQWYGTDYVRAEQGENVWIGKISEMLSDLNTKKYRYCLIIPDVRFVIEAAWIKKQGGVVLGVEREGQVNDDPHLSEQQVKRISPDWRVQNNGKTIGRLLWEVRCVKQFIWERYSLLPSITKTI